MKNNAKTSKKQKKKISNNSLLKGLIFIAIYFVISFALEMINFNALGFGIFPKNIMFDLAFWFIVCGLLYLIPNNTAKLIIGAVLIIIQIALNLVNSVLIKMTGLVFHWHQLSRAGAGAECLEPDMINYGLIVVYVLMFAAYLVATIIINKKMKAGVDFQFSKRLAFWLCSVFVLVGVGSSFIFIGKDVRGKVQEQAYAFAADSGESLCDGIYFKNANLRAMGTFGFYFHDLVALAQVNKKASDAEKAKMKEDLKIGLVDEEKAFNIAKGDNLIYILLESFDEFSIDPYNTPNLWKLAYGDVSESSDKDVKWGCSYSNFYGLNYTNNSEYISLMGHATEKQTMLDYYNDGGIANPYSLPQLFKNAKYDHVNYFHGYTKDYYERGGLYKSMGFENVYGIEDSKLEDKTKEFGDWVLDSDYIASMLDKFIPAGKSFFSYYTTISTHGPYTYQNSRYDEYKNTYDKNLENYKKFLEKEGFVYPEDKNAQEELCQYKAGVMDIDLMVEIIFKELVSQGILEKTTIVLFSDHNCFYSDLNTKVKNIYYRDFDNINLYNIPLIIYNDAIAARTSTRFCNTYDLYATICDMFGFEYNSKLTQGYSIFGSEINKSVHVSFKHGIFNQDYYTEDLIEIKQIAESPTTTIEDFKKYAYDFFVEQEIIEFVYLNNLYKQ